jgi:hypothetical protein
MTQCLTFYSFPPEYWKAIHTADAIERPVEEVKKLSTSYRRVQTKIGPGFEQLSFTVSRFFTVWY